MNNNIPKFPTLIARGLAALAATVAILLSPITFAQAVNEGTTSPPAAAPDERIPVEQEEEIVEMSPFVVSTDRDSGFIAASSLAGGRLAGDLVDTPVAYSVQTKDFLDALNISDLTEAIEWTVNATAIPDDGSGQLFGEMAPVTYIRGVRTGTAQRNFFAGNPGASAYNLERIDYTRGPNSILFGMGNISGSANLVVKTAKPRQRILDFRGLVESWGGSTGMVDINLPLGRKYALRVNGILQDIRTWRDWERTVRKGISPALTAYLTPTTTLRVVGEYYEQEVRAGEIALLDEFTAWDGVSTYSGVQANHASHTAKGVGRMIGSHVWIWSPGFGIGDNTVTRWYGMMQTIGMASGNRPINADGLTSSGNPGLRGEPILEAIAIPGEVFDAAVAGSAFRVPSRSFTAIGPTPTSKNDIRNITFFLEQRIGRSFFLELSGAANERRGLGDISLYQNNRYMRVSIDINKLLPDGRPNPGYLQPYNESTHMERQHETMTDYGVRLAAAYVKNLSWLEIKLNAMGAYESNSHTKIREYLVMKVDEDPRQWGARASTKAQLPRIRYYWNQTQRQRPIDMTSVDVIDVGNVTGLDGKTIDSGWVLAGGQHDATFRRDADVKYFQTAASLSFWKKRFILLGAYRADWVDRTQTMMLNTLEHPDKVPILRNNFLWRPEAPADYWQLTYIAKNAAGTPTTNRPAQAATRPRDTLGNALPQYKNDRFRDDYSPPGTSEERNTKSLGGILNLAYGASLWANYAETFNPSDFSKTTINYGTPPSSVSTGYDYGLRFSLLRGKFILNISRYESKEDGAASSHPSGYSTLNQIINTPPYDDPDALTNRRNLTEVPNIWLDSMDREAEGYELELVANITPNWRLTLNGAQADATQTNAYRDTRAWVAEHDGIFREILADAGVIIGPDDVAEVDPALPERPIPSVNGAKAWNDLQAVRKNWVSGTQKLRGLTEYTANFYTDYKFSRGFLKGASVGFGLRYRGKAVVAYRGADTIVDPANPTKAIDDPSVDAYTPVYQDPYVLGTLTLGYGFKIGRKTLVMLNLTVNNLFDYDKPIYIGVGYGNGLRAPAGDFASPARVTIPNRYFYTPPRSWRLSATVKF